MLVGHSITYVGARLLSGSLGLTTTILLTHLLTPSEYGVYGLALTVMTLFVPCVANFLMMVRERGLKVGLAIIGVITPVAVFTGAGLNYVLRALDVHFRQVRRV